MSAAPVFDLCGDLPTGRQTAMLEASAGTGKTHNIAGLAVRYLAAGVVEVDQLMLVTFGRAATAELRERVRERLAGVTTALADAEAARGSADDLVRFLASGPDDEVRARYRRLARAVADFDAALIATTHGFCHQMLAGLGIAADLDSDVTFAETTNDLVHDAATDLYVGDYGRADSSPPVDTFGFGVAAGIAAEAVGDPSARLEPANAAAGTDAGVRVAFAGRARSEVARRKRAMRVMDYDDLLSYLHAALTHPQTGEDACQRIRQRYQIVLVDEFQDTDPVQWQILERTFHGHRTLVLIGDPKQAIYAFRGADVMTYLLAKKAAADEQTLGTNWRSDRPLVRGLGRLLGEAALGHPDIRVHEVGAAHREPTLRGAPDSAPVRLRWAPRAQFDKPITAKVVVKEARRLVAEDVASDVVGLLSSGAEIVERRDQDWRRLRPADLAVLVHRNEDGETIRDAIARLDVPVVFLGTDSVYRSAAAHDWLVLLTALEQPHRAVLARNAALTDFVGWTAAELATADDTALDAFGSRLRRWAEVLADQGIAALNEAVTATGMVERVLAREDGERRLTDLRHIAQALHRAATEGYAGVSSLLQWLQHRRAEAARDFDDERSRRLESDAEAVQVTTIWRAKGLEWPVVYAPFLWDRWVKAKPDLMRLHDENAGRVLDVGGPTGPGYEDRRTRYLAEDSGESLRLAYVALTRARCQAVTYWVPGNNTEGAALHRLLFAEAAEDGAVPDRVKLPDDTAVRARFRTLSADSGGLVSVEVAGGGPGGRLPRPAPPRSTLQVRSFDRTLDRVWGRASYTGITAGLHEASGAASAVSEPEAPGTLDEPVEPLAEGSTPTVDPEAAASPMAGFPPGAAFGTLVHRVLERVDFAVADLSAELRRGCEAAGCERFDLQPDELAAALLPSLRTPLGPVAGGRRLVDIDSKDRLDELEFELPLAGGDPPSGTVRVREFAELLRRHLGPDDPLAGYADDLAVPLIAERRLRGFLTGSIDAVLRVRADDGTSRYLVVDYKTNRLGGGEDLTVADYRPAALAREMRRAHYPVQALLYSVALHRYLRWRQPGYRPARHLGGVLYLFLRGMSGPGAPGGDAVPSGVFSWSPPPELISELSDLLHGGVS